MLTYARGLKSKAKGALIPLARYLAKDATDLPIELWGMHVDADDRLCYAGRDVLGLVAEHGQTPVHLLDVARLDANLAALSSSRAEVYYSFKTQPLPWIVKRLVSRGAGAEVISEYELHLALHIGVPPDKIIYNGPGKSDASIRLAVERGILLFNINHLEEIDRVVRVARELGRKVRVGVRVVTSSGWSSQFGCSIASGEAMAAYQRALAYPELEVVGLHSHRGHHLFGEPQVRSFVGEVLAFADALHAKLGFVPHVLDLGGSFGVPTVRVMSDVDRRLTQTLLTPVGGPDLTKRLKPEEYVRVVASAVDDHFRARNWPAPRIAIEPGRALTGNTQALAARVMTLRESSDGFTYAVLDAGINIAGLLRQELHQIFRVSDFRVGASNTDTLYRLVGPICQPGDVIYPCVRLPALAEGDVLLIMDSGAYFEPDSTSFSFGRPATVAIEGGETQTIRRAESFDDMIHRDVF
jgi:diaminopimelate decarboxylase